MTTPGTLPPAVDAIIELGFLARIPRVLARTILAGGYRVELPMGAAIERVSGIASIAVVLDGFIRLFLQSDAGRQITVRYARPGETLGLVHVFASPTPVRTQAVTAASMSVLDAQRVEWLAATEPSLGLAVARECARRAADAMDEIALATFGSVRQRVARHLLDLASERKGDLVAAVTQQQLADAAPKTTRILGMALAGSYDAILAGTEAPDVVGDQWLFSRMLRLGDPSLSEPVLDITGSRVEYRDTEVRLTPFGQRVLDGKANFVDANGIDDWVAGVHLQSDAGRVWFHEGGQLVRRGWAESS